MIVENADQMRYVLTSARFSQVTFDKGMYIWRVFLVELAILRHHPEWNDRTTLGIQQMEHAYELVKKLRKGDFTGSPNRWPTELGWKLERCAA